jgi:hypothetical protein
MDLGWDGQTLVDGRQKTLPRGGLPGGVGKRSQEIVDQAGYGHSGLLVRGDVHDRTRTRQEGLHEIKRIGATVVAPIEETLLLRMLRGGPARNKTDWSCSSGPNLRNSY